MKIGIPKEIHPGECRVAATPDTVEKLVKLGFDVHIETGAGDAADFEDAVYLEAGGQIAQDTVSVWQDADLILKVRAPEDHPELAKHEAELLPEGACLISFVWPAQNKDVLDRLAARKATVLAMDCVPRISRAQKLDALSAMANIAGYRAVVEAAQHLPRFFAGQITAAGKIDPAKVLVIGGGVAGLSAVGTARGLGAIVRAFDTRPAVKEQVESLGAEFLELDYEEDGEGEGGYAKVMSKAFIEAEMALFAAQAMDVDVIITTALIPGKKAPELITAGMVESMKEGSVIVDLAAEQGGNCALTVPGEVIVHKRVTIVGYTDLPSRMARQSSSLYAMNLVHFLTDLGGAENFTIDLENEVTRGAIVLHKGELTWPPPKPKPVEERVVTKRIPKEDEPAPEPTTSAAAAKEESSLKGLFWLLLAGAALIGIGLGAPESFLSHFTVFVVACLLGWNLIWNVKPALHTPLMSVTNAISGIIIIGGMLHLAGPPMSASVLLGSFAVLIASINVAGGFLVTKRMLAMFHR